jgi:predicted enzyme related to lactoylglutathione lyase
MPRPIHFEIACDDPERAVKFYENVLDWKVSKWDGPMDYWLVDTGDQNSMGINGGMMRRQSPAEKIVNVMDCASVDDMVSKVVSAGGKLIAPKMAVPGVGRTAYFEDTEGNPFGVMQSDTEAR